LWVIIKSVASFSLTQRTEKKVPSKKLYQMTTKSPEHKPNVHKKYRHLPFQDTPKFTQNGIFGLKI
jgi:hypothetical protein